MTPQFSFGVFSPLSAGSSFLSSFLIFSWIYTLYILILLILKSLKLENKQFSMTFM